jgi:hypothetical protein
MQSAVGRRRAHRGAGDDVDACPLRAIDERLVQVGTQRQDHVGAIAEVMPHDVLAAFIDDRPLFDPPRVPDGSFECAQDAE